LRGLLGAGRIYVEIFGRVRSRGGEPDREIKQITVYSEDVPVDEVVFTAVGVKNQARKPVRETAITYEPSSGTIEIVGRVKALREQVAGLFAEKFLGVDLSGERLRPRRVDLSPLLDPITFAVEPQDGIARVKLTRLVISALDGSFTQWFEVPFADDDTLHDVLEDEYGAIVAAAIEELPSGVASALLATAALERCAARRTALVADDDGPRFVDLVWYPDRNVYGYFGAADGHVVLAPDAQVVFRINLPLWFGRLSACLDLTNASRPTEIVPDHAWDIGDLWITRQRKTPVLFVRRLDLSATFEALRVALAKRAGRSGGLILTSSRNLLRTIVEDQSYTG
jgi:hypothetical protein